MRTLLTILTLLLATAAFAAESYQDQWQKANKLYDQKDYENAAQLYERIAALKPAESQVYYNLGNTYYKLNDIGQAVLNYERALREDPNNKIIQDNLALTQSRINNRIYAPQDIFFVKWWKGITAATKATTWAVLSLLLFLALIGMAIAQRLNKLQLSYSMQVNGIGWSLCLVLMILAFVSAGRKSDNSKAVVMQNDSPFYTSPQQTKAQAYIPEGTTITFTEERQGWAEVTLPDGRTGWMQAGAMAKL